MMVRARIICEPLERGGVESPKRVIEDAELPEIPHVGSVFWVHRDPIGLTCKHIARRVTYVFNEDSSVCLVEVVLEDDG